MFYAVLKNVPLIPRPPGYGEGAGGGLTVPGEHLDICCGQTFPQRAEEKDKMRSPWTHSNRIGEIILGKCIEKKNESKTDIANETGLVIDR